MAWQVRKKLDDSYKKVGQSARNDLETMYFESAWKIKTAAKVRRLTPV